MFNQSMTLELVILIYEVYNRAIFSKPHGLKLFTQVLFHVLI